MRDGATRRVDPRQGHRRLPELAVKAAMRSIGCEAAYVANLTTNAFSAQLKLARKIG